MYATGPLWWLSTLVGVSALATMRGITSVMRHHTLDAQTWNLSAGNTLTAWVSSVWAGAGPVLAVAVALGFVPEHPNTLKSVYVATHSGCMESLSFSAPRPCT